MPNPTLTTSVWTETLTRATSIPTGTSINSIATILPPIPKASTGTMVSAIVTPTVIMLVVLGILYKLFRHYNRQCKYLAGSGLQQPGNRPTTELHYALIGRWMFWNVDAVMRAGGVDKETLEEKEDARRGEEEAARRRRYSWVPGMSSNPNSPTNSNFASRSSKTSCFSRPVTPTSPVMVSSEASASRRSSSWSLRSWFSGQKDSENVPTQPLEAVIVIPEDKYDLFIGQQRSPSAMSASSKPRHSVAEASRSPGINTVDGPASPYSQKQDDHATFVPDPGMKSNPPSSGKLPDANMEQIGKLGAFVPQKMGDDPVKEKSKESKFIGSIPSNASTAGENSYSTTNTPVSNRPLPRKQRPVSISVLEFDCLNPNNPSPGRTYNRTPEVSPRRDSFSNHQLSDSSATNTTITQARYDAQNGISRNSSLGTGRPSSSNYSRQISNAYGRPSSSNYSRQISNAYNPAALRGGNKTSSMPSIASTIRATILNQISGSASGSFGASRTVPTIRAPTPGRSRSRSIGHNSFVQAKRDPVVMGEYNSRSVSSEDLSIIPILDRRGSNASTIFSRRDSLCGLLDEEEDSRLSSASNKSGQSIYEDARSNYSSSRPSSSESVYEDASEQQPVQFSSCSEVTSPYAMLDVSSSVAPANNVSSNEASRLRSITPTEPTDKKTANTAKSGGEACRTDGAFYVKPVGPKLQDALKGLLKGDEWDAQEKKGWRQSFGLKSAQRKKKPKSFLGVRQSDPMDPSNFEEIYLG